MWQYSVKLNNLSVTLLSKSQALPVCLIQIDLLELLDDIPNRPVILLEKVGKAIKQARNQDFDSMRTAAKRAVVMKKRQGVSYN